MGLLHFILVAAFEHLERKLLSSLQHAEELEFL